MPFVYLLYNSFISFQKDILFIQENTHNRQKKTYARYFFLIKNRTPNANPIYA